MDTRPKRKRLGEPRGVTVFNKFEERGNDNSASSANPLNLVEVGNGRGEVSETQEADMGTTIEKKRRGRPKGSMGKKSQGSADGNSGTSKNQSNFQEVAHGCEEEQEADLCVVPKKKGRGRTRGLGVERKRQKSADGKLDVLIHPTKMVAVCPGRKDFITDLSVIVRQNARHNVYKWKKVPQGVKDTIAQKTLITHACGRKSFHAAGYDARDKVTGKELDLRTLWQLTHKKANGECVDKTSKEIHDKVAEQVVQCSGNEIARIEPEIVESAFKSLVGKKSYMRGIVSGTSTRIQGKRQAELEAQKKETEEARAKHNEVRAKLAEVESQLMEERHQLE